MVYECDHCGAALPPGVRACAKCGEAFEDAVPLDAEVPRRGFSAAPRPPAAPPALGLPRPQPGFPSPPPAYRPPPPTGLNQKISPAFLVVALLIGAFVVFGMVGKSFSDLGDAKTHQEASDQAIRAAINPGPGDPSPAANNGPMLNKLSERFSDENGYNIIAGEVRNISGEKMDNVEAVTTFYDASGGVVTTADALIDYNPILPGQTSPYKTMEQDNPAIKTERTNFQTLGGGMIADKDSSRK